MIYVITYDYSLTRFLFTDLDEVEAILIPIKRCSFLKRCIKYMLLKMGVPIGYFGMSKDQVTKIKKMKSEDSLFYLGESPKVCYELSKICKKKVRKICFFWNSCITIKKCEKKIKKIRRCDFSIATFDSKDAQKYNLIFIDQFYRSSDQNNGFSICQTDYDFFFCGRDKGRKDVLLGMQKLLSSLGQCKFIIPETNDAVPYLNYLEYLKKSKVLCDVTQKNQSGLTLRILESIFFSKKIITNNENVKEYDFYNPNNILIYRSRTSIDDIKSFLEKPYNPVSDEILSRYEVVNVLKKLFNGMVE